MSIQPVIEVACSACGTTFMGHFRRYRLCHDCKLAHKRAWSAERYRTDLATRERGKERSRERHRALRDTINPKLREHARARHLNRKLTALARYGQACECCAERNYQFLTLDHAKKDGAQHRKALLGDARSGGGPFLIALERLDWPEVPGLRTLCANCHMAIDLWGGCPHAS